MWPSPLALIDNNFEHFYTQQNGDFIQRSGKIASGHYRPEGFIIPRIGDHPREQYPTDEMNQYVEHVALKIFEGFKRSRKIHKVA